VSAFTLSVAGFALILIAVLGHVRDWRGDALAIGGDLLMGTGDVVARNWVFAAAFFALAAFVVLNRWRRKRRRSPRSLGAKARALLAAVVARMRQSLKPRHVLRPVRGGAR
jgi:hypothetical protein